LGTEILTATELLHIQVPIIRKMYIHSFRYPFPIIMSLFIHLTPVFIVIQYLSELMETKSEVLLPAFPQSSSVPGDNNNNDHGQLARWQVFLICCTVRLVTAFAVRTSYVPDEYYQVAHFHGSASKLIANI
jgi:hypothetical protein